MRLHIVPDEKIINRTIENFELVFPGDNKFVALTKNGNKGKYLNHYDCLFLCRYDSIDFWNIIGDVTQYTSIIIHYMREEAADFVCKINHSNIYWIEWGVDLYGSLLAPNGYKLYYDEDIIWKCNGQTYPRLIYKFLFFVKSKFRRNKIVKAAKRVRYFVPDSMYDEYPLLLQYYSILRKLEYKEFFYYPIDEILGTLKISKSCGNSIIVGNSSSLTGNHLYGFELLSKLDIGNRKVIVPLSYGHPKYADIVCSEGKKLLPINFCPLMDYLSLDDYNKVLLSANVFIYCNWRQEAVGNILIALYIGGKVFLDKRNPLLDFYRRLGIVIFSLDELNQNSIDTFLSDSEIQKNRKILDKYYSKERQLELIESNF